MALGRLVGEEGGISLIGELSIFGLFQVLQLVNSTLETNKKPSQHTENSLGTFTLGPQLKVSSSKVQRPFLDFREKVSSRVHVSFQISALDCLRLGHTPDNFSVRNVAQVPALYQVP